MPRRIRVDITAVAEADVHAIREFISRDKPAAAVKWVREFMRQVRRLETMPERHEIIPEAEDLAVTHRHLLFGNYRAIYRIDAKRVLILRVVHAARLLDSSFFIDM